MARRAWLGLGCCGVFHRQKAEGRANRFYVHEVFTEDEIKKLGSQQTDAAPDISGRMYRNASEFYRNIIARVMNVNDQAEGDDKNFQKWFGDSKVVDADGKPLVVYHGSDWNPLSEEPGKAVFDKKKVGKNYLHSKRGGFFFTTKRSSAENYAVLANGGKDGTVVEAYLKIEKPYEINAPEAVSAADYWDMHSSEVRNEADIAEADGIIIKHASGNLYIAFESTQIKSATDNVGTYDPANPDIRFSVAAVETDVPPIGIDIRDNVAVRDYLKAKFQGKTVEIKSDGRLTVFTRQGLEDAMKRRNEHRKAFAALDAVLENSYPVGYEPVDDKHAARRPDLRGQFVYAGLIAVQNEAGEKESYVATIKLDDSRADKRAQFKDIAITKTRSLYAGQTENPNVDLLEDRAISVQRIVDFVKRQFENIPGFIDRSSRANEEAEAGESGDSRFSLAEYSEADQRDIVTILKPYAGLYADHKPEEYAKYLAEKGVDIPEKDAWTFALEACRQNMADARKRAAKRRDDWIYENNPLWRECVDFCGGTEFRIKPSERFSGEDFSGTWISPEFVKYSQKRPQGKRESDATYRKYLARREASLKKADGTGSDELAEAIARKQGRDSLDVEQELIDYFRNLKKPDLHKQYSEWKAENLAGDREAQQRAFDEWMKSEQARVEEEVVQLLQNGKPITEEWIQENRAVYKELYRRLFQKDAPYAPGKKDMEAINAALIQEGANASIYAEAYKVAREKAYGEFMAKLREFRDRVMSSRADAVRLQRDALDFAEKNLPQEARGANGYLME